MTRYNRTTGYENHDKLGLLGDRRGAVAVWAVLMMVAMLGVTALALDMGYLWMLKNRLQATADATALAGAALLTPLAPTPNVAAVMFDVKKTAVEFARKNMPGKNMPDVPDGPHGKVLCTAGAGGEPWVVCPDGLSDVVLGHWHGKDHHAPADPDSRKFICYTADRSDPDCPKPPDETTNAVKTTTRRAEANENSVPLFFARILRVYQRDVFTSAIAEAVGSGTNNCETNGIIAGGQVLSGSQNGIVETFCIHGEEGVKVGSTNDFCGSQISMPDLDMRDFGTVNSCVDECFNDDDTVIEPPPSSCVVATQSLLPDLALEVAATIDGMKADLLSNVFFNLPDNVNIDTVTSDPPPNADDETGPWGVFGTAYVLPGQYDVTGSERTFDNIVIIAGEEINIGQGYTITNSILASGGYVDLQSNGTIGQADFCETGDGAVVIMAKEMVKVQSNTPINGGQIIAGTIADLQSDEISAKGLAIQAVDDVKLGSQLNIVGCPTAQLPFGSSSGPEPKLVN